MKYAGIIPWVLVSLFVTLVPCESVPSDIREKEQPTPCIETEKETSAAGSESAAKEDMPLQRESKGGEEEPAARSKVLVYHPPLRGSPGGRVAGGTRGGKGGTPRIFALAPEHVGLTVQDQPSLFWHLTKKTESPVELIIIEAHAADSLVETRIDPPVHPAIHRIRLADYGVRLSRGTPYQWFVSVISDPDTPSKNITASGMIERVEFPEGLQATLARSGEDESAFVYGEAGLWYDALQAISDRIDASPDDPDLRRLRSSLLGQVGLTESADFDKRHVPGGGR